MKFFTAIYLTIVNLPSLKAHLNILFLKRSLSLSIKHTAILHYFIINDRLRIKFIQSLLINMYWKVLAGFSGVALLIAICVMVA